MYGSFQDGYDEESFANIKNLTYKKTFNGLSSIETSAYDLFLYTSENDGIPNIILEATSLGLPIVSSKAGGIAEFITSSTGKLIKNREDAQLYIEAIEEVINNDDLRINLVRAAQKKLRTQHSSTQFLKKIKEDIN
jgi:glycosyltransferase involved in cell wall biosynthesis